MEISDDDVRKAASNIERITNSLFKSIQANEKLTLTDIIKNSEWSNTFTNYIQNPPAEDFNKLGIKFVEFSNLRTHEFSLDQLKFYVLTLTTHWLGKMGDNTQLKVKMEDFKTRAKRVNHVNKLSTTTKTTTTLSIPTITAAEDNSELAFYKKIKDIGGEDKKVNTLSLTPHTSTLPFSKYVDQKSENPTFNIHDTLIKEINKLTVAKKLVAYSVIKKIVEQD